MPTWFLAPKAELKLPTLAGWYDNPIPTRFLAPKDCLKIPALKERRTNLKGFLNRLNKGRKFFKVLGHSKTSDIPPLWLLLTVFQKEEGYVKVSKKERLFSGDSQPVMCQKI